MTSTCSAVGSFPVALTLISHAHQAAVLSHPKWIDVVSASDPAQQLVWMVEQGLLSYDELDELQTFEEKPSEQDRIVEEAYAVLGQRNTVANRELLEQLLGDRLITPAQHASVLALPLAEPCDSAASLLFSIVRIGIMSPCEFDSLYADVLAEQAHGTSERQWETVKLTYAALRNHEAQVSSGTSALDKAKRQANFQLAFCLVGAMAMAWYIVGHWPA